MYPLTFIPICGRPRGNRILPLQQLQGSRHRHPNLAGRHPQKDPNRKGH